MQIDCRLHADRRQSTEKSIPFTKTVRIKEEGRVRIQRDGFLVMNVFIRRGTFVRPKSSYQHEPSDSQVQAYRKLVT